MFVALSTKKLPFICEKMTPSRDGFVESRLAALEMQMKDVMSHTSPSSFSVTTTHPRTYSACVDNGIRNKQRQQHHVPQPAQTMPLPDSFNNKPAYNTDFPLPSLTQTKYPADHSAPQHGQTQQDPTNSGHAWNIVKGSRPRPRRPKAVYGTKQSDGLRAPPRGYDCVVFNVTTSDKEEVRKWMSDNSVDVMDIVPLSKDDSDVHMFKVKVHYKDKDTVLSSDFWPEFVGCRYYFYKKRVDISSKNTNTNHD